VATKSRGFQNSRWGSSGVLIIGSGLHPDTELETTKSRVSENMCGWWHNGHRVVELFKFSSCGCKSSGVLGLHDDNELDTTKFRVLTICAFLKRPCERTDSCMNSALTRTPREFRAEPSSPWFDYTPRSRWTRGRGQSIPWLSAIADFQIAPQFLERRDPMRRLNRPTVFECKDNSTLCCSSCGACMALQPSLEILKP
jgi:hypothetical protein